jgi:hypothetical protein
MLNFAHQNALIADALALQKSYLKPEISYCAANCNKL